MIKFFKKKEHIKIYSLQYLKNIDKEIDIFRDLPLAAEYDKKVIYVKNNSITIPTKLSGFYLSDGVSWNRLSNNDEMEALCERLQERDEVIKHNTKVRTRILYAKILFCIVCITTSATLLIIKF
tara:strand:- start:182 stop:553 length:372 start_codon:yes stop_codon:yes gene_type:complete